MKVTDKNQQPNLKLNLKEVKEPQLKLSAVGNGKGSFADIMKNIQSMNQENLEDSRILFPGIIENDLIAKNESEPAIETSEEKNKQDELAAEDEEKKKKIKKSAEGEGEILSLTARPVIHEKTATNKEVVAEKSEGPSLKYNETSALLQKEKKAEDGIASLVEDIKQSLVTHKKESKEEIVAIKKDSKEELSVINKENRKETVQEPVAGKPDNHHGKKETLANEEKSVKPAVAEVKETAHKTEQVMETVFLDKSKWEIRREKEVEISRMERNVRVQPNTVQQTASSQNSSFSGESERKQGEERKMNIMDAVTRQFKKNDSVPANRELPTSRQSQLRSNLNDLVKAAKMTIVNNGKSSVSIQMSPKDLGKITLNVSVLKDKVEGRIIVESEIVKQQLLLDMGNLKNDLKFAGLELTDLQIDVREENLYAGFEDNTKEKQKNANGSSSGYSENSGYTDDMNEQPLIKSSEYLVDIRI